MKDSQLILVILLTYTSISRIIELYLAVFYQKKRTQNPNVRLVREKYYFLFIILHIFVFLIIPLEVFLLDREFIFSLGFICFCMFIIASLLRFYTLWTLKSFWNTKLIFNLSSDEIVIDGPYRFIRHPNYLVVILEITTLSLFHSAYISFLVLSLWNSVLLYVRIKREEEMLFQNPKYKKHFLYKNRFFPKVKRQ